MSGIILLFLISSSVFKLLYFVLYHISTMKKNPSLVYLCVVLSLTNGILVLMKHKTHDSPDVCCSYLTIML